MGVQFIGLEPSASFGDEVPACPHGPMLLFERADRSKKAGRQFYACAACRDRKACSFFLWRDERLTPEKVRRWRERVAELAGPATEHTLRYDSARKILQEGGHYCLDCSRLVLSSELRRHQAHETRAAGSSVPRPSELLRPKAANKAEAQYLFSEATVAVLLSLLRQAGAVRVLCCGTPRLHERLQESGAASLMLDCDRRYEEFWPPERLCIYNMFNHHMFSSSDWDTYRDFVGREGGKGLAVVVDPPFGGRLEALARTISAISDDWTTARSATDRPPAESADRPPAESTEPPPAESAEPPPAGSADRPPAKSADRPPAESAEPPPAGSADRPPVESAERPPAESADQLPVFLILPYFNEPDVRRCMPNLVMTDFRVEYENHDKFTSDAGGRTHGSPVRLFSSVAAERLRLPAPAYRLCPPCRRWVHADNVHCARCDSCTAKDGRPYRHCDQCGRCVKNTWRHCAECGRCALPDHPCTADAAAAARKRSGKPSRNRQKKRRSQHQN